MKNKQPRLNKTFRFNSFVYVVHIGVYGDFTLVKGRIVGVCEFHTSYSDLLYSVETSYGRFEALPCNIYESVHEFVEEAQQHVVE